MADLKKKEPLPMPPPPAPLYKQRSWSPDTDRDEAWQRRKGIYKSRRKEAAVGHLHCLSRSVTDEDLEELRGCIDLGFGFESPVSTVTASSDDADRLSDTLPALDLYYAVHRSNPGPVAAGSKCEPSSSVSPAGSPLSIYSPDESEWEGRKQILPWVLSGSVCLQISALAPSAAVGALAPNSLFLLSNVPRSQLPGVPSPTGGTPRAAASLCKAARVISERAAAAAFAAEYAHLKVP